MAVREVRGHGHDKAFRVTTARGEARTFDSFGCVIHAHCAQEESATGLQDRA